LRFWFDGRDDLGLAVILGDPSGGLVCRDFDSHEDYGRWKTTQSKLASQLPTVATARGAHVYFRAPPEFLLYSALSPREKGEYRGNAGHYCLLPPSRHPDGPEYRWLVPLPAGAIPFVADVVAAGLLPAHVTQKAHEVARKSQVVVGCEGVARTPVENKREPVDCRVSAEMAVVIEEAIARTIPTRPGMRRGKLFELARRLKFHPAFAGIPTTQLDCLETYLQKWWTAAKPNTSGDHPHFRESWKDFVFAWEEARIPYGETLKVAFERAQSAPPSRKAVAQYGEGSARTLLATFCRELQQLNDGEFFWLSGRDAGPLLGVADVHAWRWLRILQADKIIELLKKYPSGVRKACEYRYTGD
jgi:hypothetical protein